MLLRHDWVIFAEQEGMILIGLVAEENFETSLYTFIVSCRPEIEKITLCID